jgi:uncharacterized membrane protein YhaH (DUF805 family)
MNWYLVAFKKYAVFSGRARRKEYWFFVLFNTLIMIGLVVLEFLSGLAIKEMGVGVGLITVLYGLVIFLPSLAVAVRRLHDTGRSGWWYLLSLVPLLGAIILIVFLATDSDYRANKYGPNPKETAAPAIAAAPA